MRSVTVQGSDPLPNGYISRPEGRRGATRCTIFLRRKKLNVAILSVEGGNDSQRSFTQQRYIDFNVTHTILSHD